MIEATVRQASLALIQVADLNPQAFAAALGVEQNLATAQALRHLQAADAATQTLRELSLELATAESQSKAEDLLKAFGTRLKQTLEVRLSSQVTVFVSALSVHNIEGRTSARC